MYEIHISDVKQFLGCRRRWDWQSPIRQGLERRDVYAPFFLGRGVHYAMQRFYEVGETPSASLNRFITAEVERLKPLGTLWQFEKDTIEEQSALAFGLMEHYVDWTTSTHGAWQDDNLNFYALETTFKVPIHNAQGKRSRRFCLAGRFDGVVQRKDNGTYWILEHKTTRSIDELKVSLVNELQTAAYIYAASKMYGIDVRGVLYNIIRKKLPTEPRVLVSGMLSVAQIDTTPQAYVKAIRRNHPEWIDTDGHFTEEGSKEMMLQYGCYLRGIETKSFFERVPVRRTAGEIEQFGRDLHCIASEMCKPLVRTYPTPDWFGCKMCRFKPACLTMNAGGDYVSILEAEFTPRREWNPETAEDAEVHNG